jgi:hypothetical protein
MKRYLLLLAIILLATAAVMATALNTGKKSSKSPQERSIKKTSCTKGASVACY